MFYKCLVRFWKVITPVDLLLLRSAVSTIYKIGGRFLSVYEHTSALHEYLCTLRKNGHEFCNLLLKRTQIVVQLNYI